MCITLYFGGDPCVSDKVCMYVMVRARSFVQAITTCVSYSFPKESRHVKVLLSDAAYSISTIIHMNIYLSRDWVNEFYS